MAMPEAAVDEDDRPVLWQDNIRGAWEALVIDPISKSLVPESMSQIHFRFGIGRFNCSHDLALQRIVGHNL